MLVCKFLSCALIEKHGKGLGTRLYTCNNMCVRALREGGEGASDITSLYDVCLSACRATRLTLAYEWSKLSSRCQM